MLSLFSHLRNRNKKAMEQKASNMAPEKRSQLTQDILNSGITAASTKEDMEDIENDLEEASELLHKAEKSEQFVGMRFRKYQALLRERAVALVEDEDETVVADETTTEEDDNYTGGIAIKSNSDDDDDDDDDEEVVNDEEAGRAQPLTPEQRLVQVQKLQRDEAALFKVGQQYATLQETTRALKKKVFVLERRRDIMLQQAQECQEFVIAAAVAERDEAGYVFDDEDDEEDTTTSDTPQQRASWAVEEDMNNLNINDDDSDDDNDEEEEDTGTGEQRCESADE